MQAIDEITRKEIKNYRIVVVDHIPGQVIFGYIPRNAPLTTVMVYTEGYLQTFQTYLPLLKDKLVFSKRSGLYMSTIDLPHELLLQETMIMGQGSFPYHFERKYEAIENFNIFDDKQKVVKFTSNPISKHLKYTFGLEFETSQGYIPEDICFRDGLIPLRDGSISGLEYSTVVLGGNKGICLLKQQLKTLKEYTNFNKECSLHMHFGGFPIQSDALFRAFWVWKKLEGEIENIVPPLTFNSGEYKANGKNYCRKLPPFRTFDQMYEGLVGRRFFGSLIQPHPADITRQHKWNIKTRYYAVNFINALCYNVNKTIEFRFLRPTYNYNKILLWIYIFNAMLQFAETNEDMNAYSGLSLRSLIQSVYPSPLAEAVNDGIIRLSILTANQCENDDRCGAFTDLEDKLFKGNLGY